MKDNRVYRSNGKSLLPSKTLLRMEGPSMPLGLNRIVHRERSTRHFRPDAITVLAYNSDFNCRKPTKCCMVEYGSGLYPFLSSATPFFFFFRISESKKFKFL